MGEAFEIRRVLHDFRRVGIADGRACMKRVVRTPIICPECLRKNVVSPDGIGCIKPIDRVFSSELFICLDCGAAFAVRRDSGRTEYEESDGILALDA